MRLPQGSKTYLDLPSFYEPPEYSVVICADDDEYAGRSKVLQKFLSFDDPSTSPTANAVAVAVAATTTTTTSSTSGASLHRAPSTAAAAAQAAACAQAAHDRRRRKLMDISGLAAAVELLEMGPGTDQAMLRYQVEYADAFAFVFSLYAGSTLETAQHLHGKVSRAARNLHNIATMSEYDRADAAMAVPVFLIGNRDADLAPPQEMGDGEAFSPAAFAARAAAEMAAQRARARALAQAWGCAYFEVDTAQRQGESGVDEAVTGIAHCVRATERPSTSSTAAFRAPRKPPRQYRIRRLLGRLGRMTPFD